MAYKCLECGHIFEDGEQANWKEDISGYGESPFWKELCGCPKCGGVFEETKPCKFCGSEHLDVELNSNLCDECIDKYKYDVDMCFRIGSRCEEKVNLNSFLLSLFDKDDIEAILYRKLKEAEKKEAVDCGYFIDSDRIWFGAELEELEEEVMKYENKKKQQR